MRRFLGSGKKEPAPDLNDAIQKVNSRSEGIEQKINKLDADLVKLRDQMAKMREGPSKNLLKQKALNILKQKRYYEEQKGQLDQQTFNMDQSHFAIQSMKDNQITYAAMKDGLKVMKREYKKLDIDKIENLQDQMADMIEMNNDIQEAMSRQYDTPDIDEADLEAELAMLGDELELPSSDMNYMEEALNAPGVPSASLDTAPKVPAGGLEVDEFGLPKIPASLL